MASDDTYMMMVDGKVQAVDLAPMLRRHRAAIVQARAAAMSEVVEALAVESIDIADLLDASGLPEPERDAACYLALSLRLAELSGPDGG
jgi:hypothetical protein